MPSICYDIKIAVLNIRSIILAAEGADRIELCGKHLGFKVCNWNIDASVNRLPIEVTFHQAFDRKKNIDFSLASS